MFFLQDLKLIYLTQHNLLTGVLPFLTMVCCSLFTSLMGRSIEMKELVFLWMLLHEMHFEMLFILPSKTCNKCYVLRSDSYLNSPIDYNFYNDFNTDSHYSIVFYSNLIRKSQVTNTSETRLPNAFKIFR